MCVCVCVCVYVCVFNTYKHSVGPDSIKPCLGLTFIMTENLPMPLRMLNQTPVEEKKERKCKRCVRHRSKTLSLNKEFTWSALGLLQSHITQAFISNTSLGLSTGCKQHGAQYTNTVSLCVGVWYVCVCVSVCTQGCRQV